MIRDMWNRGSVFEWECPACRGTGLYTGPVPWPRCLRCGGFGTIVLLDPPTATTHGGAE